MDGDPLLAHAPTQRGHWHWGSTAAWKEGFYADLVSPFHGIDHDNTVRPNTTLQEITRHLATYNLVAAPVVDERDRLLGAVSVDDVLDHLLPEGWRDTDRDVSKIGGIEWYPYNGEDPRHFKHGIRTHEDYEEFRVLDPGGYIIEFYRWKSGKAP